MAKIGGTLGKILNILYNLLKWGKQGGLFQKGPKPPVAGLIILAMVLGGCAHFGAVVKECVDLAQVCEIETSNGKCVCKPQPSPTPIPSPQPSPAVPPTPPIPPVEPTPSPSPTLPPTDGCDGLSESSSRVCDEQAPDAMFLFREQVEAAQAELGVSSTDKERPELYADQLAQLLRFKYGLCAKSGHPQNSDEVWVKQTNSRSEHYDVVTGQGLIWISPETICNPAGF